MLMIPCDADGVETSVWSFPFTHGWAFCSQVVEAPLNNWWFNRTWLTWVESSSGKHHTQWPPADQQKHSSLAMSDWWVCKPITRLFTGSLPFFFLRPSQLLIFRSWNFSISCLQEQNSLLKISTNAITYLVLGLEKFIQLRMANRGGREMLLITQKAINRSI